MIGAIARRLWRLSAARSVAVAVAMALALYALLLTAWAATSPASTVNAIVQGAPFWAAYALILLNLIACSIQFLPAVLRRASLADAEKPSGPEVRVDLPAAAKDVALRLPAALRRAGFSRTCATADGGVFGLRHGTAPFGTTVFHAGLLVLAAGLFVSSRHRFAGEAILARGQSFGGAAQEYVSAEWPRAGGLPPAVAFDVEDIGAAFFDGQLLFTDLWSRLALRRPGGAEQVTVRLSDPWRSLATWVHVTGFAYAPDLAIEDGAGQPVVSAVVRLQGFPPGRRDGFDVPGLPHRIYVEVYPDFAPATDGSLASRTPSIVSPRVRLVVMRQRVTVADGIMAPGEGLAFDGFTVRFSGLEPMGTFRVVHDPGWPAAVAGLAFTLAGLVWRLARSRIDVWARVERGDGVPRLAVRARGDLVPADAGQWARRVAKALSEAA